MRIRTTASIPSQERELIPYAYYSTRKTTVNVKTYDFFTYTLGGKHPDSALPATISDTNLKKENAIETPNRFWLKSIELIANVPLTTADCDEVIRRLLSGGIFTLKIGTQEKIVDIIEHLLSPSQVWKSTQIVKSSYVIKPKPILLLPEHYFSFTVEYGEVPPAGFTLKAIFNGNLVKPTSA